jgi:hypothetical protein
MRSASSGASQEIIRTLEASFESYERQTQSRHRLYRPQQRIVKLLRPGDVVAADQDMAEHSVLSSAEPNDRYTAPYRLGQHARTGDHRAKIWRPAPSAKAMAVAKDPPWRNL